MSDILIVPRRDAKRPKPILPGKIVVTQNEMQIPGASRAVLQTADAFAKNILTHQDETKKSI